MKAIAFFDAGRVRNHDAGDGVTGKQGASSVGLGLRASVSQQLSFALDWAHVLNGTDQTRSGHNRGHVSVIFRY